MVISQKALYFAVLHNIYTKGTGGARITPRNGIVAYGARPALDKPADNRKSGGGVHIVRADHLRHLFTAHDFRVDSIELHCICPAHNVVHVMWRVSQCDDASLREHDVVVQIAAEIFV